MQNTERQDIYTRITSKIVAALKASPAVSNISAKTFNVLGDHTAITRGPLTAAVAAAG